jgi:hypothetical protein
MHDLRSTPMQFTEDTQDREKRAAGEEAVDRVEADILRLPRATKPRTAAELQRWLDMCG